MKYFIKKYLISDLSQLNFCFNGPKFLYTKFQFENFVQNNSCFVNHAE